MDVSGEPAYFINELLSIGVEVLNGETCSSYRPRV
jgi:hypothetical protein